MTDCICNTWGITTDDAELREAWYGRQMRHHPACPARQTSTLVTYLRGLVGEGRLGEALCWADNAGDEVAIEYVAAHASGLSMVARTAELLRGALSLVDGQAWRVVSVELGDGYCEGVVWITLECQGQQAEFEVNAEPLSPADAVGEAWGYIESCTPEPTVSIPGWGTIIV